MGGVYACTAVKHELHFCVLSGFHRDTMVTGTVVKLKIYIMYHIYISASTIVTCFLAEVTLYTCLSFI